MKQMNRIKKSVSLFLCVLLLAAAAMGMTGCSENKNSSSTAQQSSSVVQDSSVPESSSAAQDSQSTDLQVLGEGDTTFEFVATDADGKTTSYEIHTDKKTVGEALLELDLIAGDEGDYGLYVKQVCGITADYDTDGSYWAFYIDGEYASTGVDSTDIVPGSVYEFRVEKG